MSVPTTRPTMGNEDLLRLCDRVALYRLSWPVANVSWADIIETSGRLRARLWRQYCAATGVTTRSCIEAGHPCLAPAHCLAERWMPNPATTGAARWRMATVFLRLDPLAGELVLWALGELNTAERDALAATMRPWVGEQACHYRVGQLGTLAPAVPGRYRLRLTTPWVLDKVSPRRVSPTIGDFAVRLRSSIEQRMHKFAALACQCPGVIGMPEEIGRLIGFTARYVAQNLLAHDLQVESSDLELQAFGIPSRSTGRVVPYCVVTGDVIVQVGIQALPWLALLSIVGGGKAPDKGFGGIALETLD